MVTLPGATVILPAPFIESMLKVGALSPCFTPLPSPPPALFSEAGFFASGAPEPPQPTATVATRAEMQRLVARRFAGLETLIRMRMGGEFTANFDSAESEAISSSLPMNRRAGLSPMKSRRPPCSCE